MLVAVEGQVSQNPVMEIAFYAPMKAPDHATPSGDRQVARGLIAAMKLAGHRVTLVSRTRSFSKTGHDPAFVDECRREADGIVERWAGRWPDIWFSYHPYYKAPDFLALPVAQRTGVPIVTAEASLAARRQRDEWAASQAYVFDIVSEAAANFYFTERDRDGLLMAAGPDSLVHLPPFIDTAPFAPGAASDGPVRLLAAGMMRGGVKLESYQYLAAALAQLDDLGWRLDIAGDGSGRDDVEALFSQFGRRVRFLGAVAHGAMPAAYGTADVFVWPGVGEAFGISYLEAQASGLPVVAFDTHGVPWSVERGKTALLSPVGDAQALADNLRRLIVDKELRARMGAKARNFAVGKRGLEAAGLLIDRVLRKAVDDRAY